MKKFAIVFCMLFLLQSCMTSKVTAVSDLKQDKFYEMELHSTLNIRGKFQQVQNDSVEFKVRHRNLKIAQNDIKQIIRKKPAVIKSLSVFAVIATGIAVK